MIETLVCLAISKALIYDKISLYSKELGAYEGMVSYIVKNEAEKTSSGDFLPCGDGDKDLTDKNGNPHQSRGIVQINKFYHPEITDQEAYNPDFAIQWLISKLREGHCSEWTTCRAFKKLYPNHPYFNTSSVLSTESKLSDSS